MLIIFEDRLSDSPVIERVWRSHSETAGTFHSMASCTWGMVVTRHEGKTFLTVRSPETMATVTDCPADGEWIGIQFKLGTFMPILPTSSLRNRNDVTLPGLSSRTFCLNGYRWEYPSFENVVQQPVKRGLIAKDSGVETAQVDCRRKHSLRTEQRHFLRVTGMTQTTVRQIERARRATYLLKHGASILQVVYDLGYYDQAH